MAKLKLCWRSNSRFCGELIESYFLTSDATQARSCITSLMDTPIDPINLHSSDIPPGLSLTVTSHLTSLPSAASPLSRHRPSIVVSMFPPVNSKTTLALKLN
ncbi:hypothetical protein NQ317_008986 [Molorchus minor]|uniref:Uncharacterized protein n=1 Tax=Molorchus minor TaxID=1323400 RepID=A0ABQ9J8T3_9CUCU|nr:hypothetical protein NQ317_008986 [Molorchus minor]